MMQAAGKFPFLQHMKGHDNSGKHCTLSAERHIIPEEGCTDSRDDSGYADKDNPVDVAPFV